MRLCAITIFLFAITSGFSQSNREWQAKWEFPVQSVDISNIAALNNGTLIVSTVGYRPFIGLRTHELIGINRSSGDVLWRKPHYGEDFIPLLTGKDLIGYSISWFTDSEIKTFNFISIDQAGNEKWQVGVSGNFIDFSIVDESLLCWYQFMEKWYLKKVNLETGKSYQKVINVEWDPALGTATSADHFFLFGKDRMTVYDSLTASTYQYPQILSASSNAVINMGNQFLVAIGEMIFRWKPNTDLKPVMDNSDQVTEKYSRIDQSLSAAGLTSESIFYPDSQTDIKGKKGEAKLRSLARAYDDFVNELNLSGVAASEKNVITSHRIGEEFIFRRFDNNLDEYDEASLNTELFSNLITIGDAVYFTTRQYLFKWNTQESSPEQVLALGDLTSDPVELRNHNDNLLISGRNGFLLYSVDSRKVVASMITPADQAVSTGYHAIKPEIAKSRLNDTGSVFRGQAVVVSDNTWRERNLALDQQIQREPHNRSLLVQQKMINTSIGLSFDKVYTASSLLGANLALMDAMDAMRDRDKLENLIPGSRIAERVVASEMASRLRGDYYLLPEFDNGWFLNICNLADQSYAKISLASYDELREVNAYIYFTYYLDEESKQVFIRTDDEGNPGYEILAYFKRPKSFMAAKETIFPYASLTAIELEELNWKPLDAIVPSEKEKEDMRLIDGVKKRDIETCRDLLKKGIDVNQRDRFGMSAFLWAVALDDPDLVDLILKYDPDGGVQDVLGWTAFTYLEALSLGSPRVNAVKVTGRVKKDLK